MPQTGEVRRLVGAVRRDVPHYGDGATPLNELDVFLLADRAGVGIVPADIDSAWLLIPRKPRGRDLFVRASLPDVAQMWLALVETARTRLGQVEGARRTAEAFAAVGLHPLLVDSADDLRTLGGEWFATAYPRAWTAACAIVCSQAEAPVLSAADLYDLGRDAREERDHPKAAAVFAEAARVGECSGDWLTVARAWTALGTFEAREGNYREARKLYGRALQTIEDHGLCEQYPLTLHDAFALEAQDGRERAALDFATRALEHYDRASPGFLRLAHDVANYLVDHRLYLRALPILHAVGDRLEDPYISACALANLVESAAALGDRDLFARAEARLAAAVLSQDGHPHTPRSYLSIATGALMLEDWAKAEAAAECAMVEAEHLRQRSVEAKAKRALEAARAQYVDDRGESGSRLPDGLLSAWDGLADDVLAALEDPAAAGARKV